jgi:putative ABC transport system permease protein
MSSDLRYALRTLGKTPSFTAIAIICLALGIGVNATIFSCVNALLLRPFPYRDPQNLVAIRDENPKKGWTGNSITYPNFVDWRAEAKSLAGAGAYTGRAYNVAVGDEPEYVQGAGVSASMFRVLGVRPVLGRDFREEEDRVGAEKVALIGHGLWQRRFAGDTKIIGRQLKLNDENYTVIGVMPEKFAFPEVAQIWTPLSFDPTKFRGNHSLEAIARLKPGVSRAQAQSELVAIARRLELQYPESNTGWTVSVATLNEAELGPEVKSVVLIMMGAVTFVLMIACANVANLLLARTAERGKEIAIRTALGAGRARIVRQLLTESVLLAGAGGVLGIAVAHWGLKLIVANIPVTLPFWMEFNIDPTVLAFTMAVALGTGIIFGLAPALQASNPNLNETLRESGRGTSAGRRRQRTRSALVVTEVALSMVLLVGATLMIRSFLGLQQVDPGFDRRGVLALRMFLGGSAYDSLYQRRAFFERVLPRVRELPGVEAVSAVNNAPLSGSNNSSSFVVEGQTVALGDEPNAAWRSITPQYLATLKVPLRKGRMFTEQELADSAKVAVVNETMVQRFWPNEEPIGKRLRFGTANDTNPEWYQVIGVAADVKQRRLNAKPENQFYIPYTQAAYRGMSLLVRTTAEPSRSTDAVLRAIHSVDPNLPAYNVMTMDAMYRQSFWQPRLYGMMFGSFAFIALVLAAVGVYGVISYSVVQRTQEIGVRVALGAQTMDVLRLIVSHGMLLAGIGVGIGILGALGITRLLTSLLFGVTATDPLTFVAIPLLVAAIAFVASVVPARRAARVDPVVALRND